MLDILGANIEPSRSKSSAFCVGAEIAFSPAALFALEPWLSHVVAPGVGLLAVVIAAAPGVGLLAAIVAAAIALSGGGAARSCSRSRSSALFLSSMPNAGLDAKDLSRPSSLAAAWILAISFPKKSLFPPVPVGLVSFFSALAFAAPCCA